MNDTVKSGIIALLTSALFFFLQFVIPKIPLRTASIISLSIGAVLFVILFLYSKRKHADSRQQVANFVATGQTILQGNFIRDSTIIVTAGDAESKNDSSSIESTGVNKESIRLDLVPQPLSVADAFDLSAAPEKQSVSRRINEAIEYMNRRQFEEARNLLFGLVADIKAKPGFERERARIYNNLGVTYNLPDDYGDTERAKIFFHQALTEDGSFFQAKLNLGLAYIEENTENDLQRGFDTIMAVWNSIGGKDQLPEKDLSALVGAAAWAIYRRQGPAAGCSFLDGLQGKVSEVAIKTVPVLHLLVSMRVEIGNEEQALQECEDALKRCPDDASLLMAMARIVVKRALKNSGEVLGLSLVPDIADKDGVEHALELFRKAEQNAQMQHAAFLIPDIQLGIIQCQLLLGKFDEAPASLRKIRESELPEELLQHLGVLTFTTLLARRQFESALRTLRDSPTYSQITYSEKKLLARRFTFRGAPEQAAEILMELTAQADGKKDIEFWLDYALIMILLDRQQEAISAANRAKRIADATDLSSESRKQFLSHYSAILMRYAAKRGRDEGGRLLPAILEFQKEFPNEKIVIPVKAIDENGELTEEIKKMITDQRSAHTRLRDNFRRFPIPTYTFVKGLKWGYPEFVALKRDPEFTIEFTMPDQTFLAKLIVTYAESQTLIFDYLSLLDLSSTELLGFLERTGKQVLVHESLFHAIEDDLIMYELPELRRLWDFLRRSSSVKLITSAPDVTFATGNLSEYFDDWLVSCLKHAKANKLPLVTDDLRLFRLLELEGIGSLNIMPIIDQLLIKGDLDERAYSSVLGHLAERYYVFLSFRAEDLANIVSADDYKITPRTYHMVNQMLLPGSNWSSFISVFAEYVRILWRADVLAQDKVAWLEFLSRKIFQLAGRVLADNGEADVTVLAEGVVLMWKEAIDCGAKGDLQALVPRIDQIFDKATLPGIGDPIREYLKTKTES
jgi:tetratricopeptide (TPR) repeat protein